MKVGARNVGPAHRTPRVVVIRDASEAATLE